MRRVLIFTALFLVPFCGLAKEKQAKHPELCVLQTADVSGNSESATIARREVERRTWLKLEPDPAKANALLEISEVRSTKRFIIPSEQVTVSAALTQGGKILWSGSTSFGEGVFNSGAGSATKILLSRLNKDAGCGK